MRLLDEINAENDAMDGLTGLYGNPNALMLSLEDWTPAELDEWEDEPEDRELEILGAHDIQLRYERLQEWIQCVHTHTFSFYNSLTAVESFLVKITMHGRVCDLGPLASNVPTLAGPK